MVSAESTVVDAQLRELALQLGDDLPHLVDVQLDALVALPAYHGLPRDHLTPSCVRNALRIIAAIGGDVAPSGPDVEDEQQSLRLRMQQGVSSDDVHDAYRGIVGVLRDAVLAKARSLDVPAEVLLVVVQRIWTLHDEVMAQMVSRRNRVELAMMARQQSARATFFAQLFEGRYTPDELAEVGPRYGLHPAAHYWFALCESTLDDIVAVIEQEGHGDGGRALVGFHQGRIAGLLSRQLPHHPAFEHTTIACVGPYAAVDSHRAAAAAADILRAARAFSMEGVVTEARIGLRLAVVHDRAMGELLYQRFVVPVGKGAAADDIRATVREYLRSQRSVIATAEALFVHANTVRYRLAKYRDLTGADFDVAQTVAELWWAFEYQAVRTEMRGPSAS